MWDLGLRAGNWYPSALGRLGTRHGLTGCAGAFAAFRTRKERAMKLSARNVFKGKVVEANVGPINSTVKVDIGNGNIVTSMITANAVADLGIAVGDEVHVVIKSSDVMLAV
jgi:molybdopterin-binding protein